MTSPERVRELECEHATEFLRTLGEAADAEAVAAATREARERLAD